MKNLPFNSNSDPQQAGPSHGVAWINRRLLESNFSADVVVSGSLALPQGNIVFANSVPVYEVNSPGLKGAPTAAFIAHASRGVAGADILVDLGTGHYAEAAVSGVIAGTMEAAQTKAGEEVIANGLEAMKFTARRIPGLGAIVTSGFVAEEASANALKGEWGKAGAALLAGGAEITGNFLGFGVGDVAREAVRASIIYTAGEAYAPDKAGMREIVENAYILVAAPEENKLLPCDVTSYPAENKLNPFPS